jgi:glycosyltransferase involved in cell wall biosynthesis
MTGHQAGPTVVFVDHSAALSGGEIALVRTLKALDIPSHVVLAEEGPLVQQLVAAGANVHVHELPARTRSMDRSELLASPRATAAVARDLSTYTRQLARLILGVKADLVHANSLKAGYYGCTAARLARVPAIWHLRDRLAADYMPERSVRLTQAAITVLPTDVVVNSLTTAATLPTRWRRHAVVVPDPYTPPGASPRTTYQQEVDVVLVGRLAPWKGQMLLLDALDELRRQRPDVRARIVGEALFGEDEYAAAVRARCAEPGLAGHVDLPGFVSDIPAVLASAKVFAHTSTVPEPFGQVVVEALAAGIPVVVPDQGGPAEIVRDGVDGLHYRMGDPHDLARALRVLLEDEALRVRLAEVGRRRADDFSPEKTRAALMAVYERAIGAR